MIEQEVNHDAGDRNVHPERPGPTGDFFVQVESPPEGATESYEDQRHDDDGEERVREENEKINRPEPGGVLEDRRSLMQVISQIRVVRDIRNQKQSGGDESTHHAVAVRDLVIPSNKATP